MYSRFETIGGNSFTKFKHMVAFWVTRNIGYKVNVYLTNTNLAQIKHGLKSCKKIYKYKHNITKEINLIVSIY